MINELGLTYLSEQRPYVKLLAKTTLGNIGNYQDMACSSAPLPDTMNFATYIGFQCPTGMTMTGLNHLGMAFQNETCTGIGISKKVETIERCTQKGDGFNEKIKLRFENDCLGKDVCSMLIDYDEMFMQP